MPQRLKTTSYRTRKKLKPFVISGRTPSFILVLQRLNAPLLSRASWCFVEFIYKYIKAFELIVVCVGQNNELIKKPQQQGDSCQTLDLSLSRSCPSYWGLFGVHRFGSISQVKSFAASLDITCHANRNGLLRWVFKAETAEQKGHAAGMSSLSYCK